MTINEFENALMAGYAEASRPDGDVGGGVLIRMTRRQAKQKLEKLERAVDKLTDRVLVAREQGRTKRADRAYAQAVTKQAAANDLRELLDTGHVARVIE